MKCLRGFLRKCGKYFKAEKYFTLVLPLKFEQKKLRTVISTMKFTNLVKHKWMTFYNTQEQTNQIWDEKLSIIRTRAQNENCCQNISNLMLDMTVKFSTTINPKQNYLSLIFFFFLIRVGGSKMEIYGKRLYLL